MHNTFFKDINITTCRRFRCWSCFAVAGVSPRGGDGVTSLPAASSLKDTEPAAQRGETSAKFVSGAFKRLDRELETRTHVEMCVNKVEKSILNKQPQCKTFSTGVFLQTRPYLMTEAHPLSSHTLL